MKPINTAERITAIARFSLVYLATLLMVSFLIYFSFVVVPKKQFEMTAITDQQIENLFRHTVDADTLVMQIQKAPEVTTKALVPLFKWTGDLQSAYRQPFYTTIITSYVDLFNEIIKGKTGDTTLVAMKSRISALQKENLVLMQQQDDLNNELAGAKMKRE